MSKKRKLTLRLEQNEAAVVADIGTLEYMVSMFKTYANDSLKDRESYYDEWMNLAHLFQYWLDETKYGFDEEEQENIR